MLKITLALLAIGATTLTAQSCSYDPTDNYDKCDTIGCARDNECLYFDCEQGFCWSWAGRPTNCTTDPTQGFYVCDGL